MKKSKLILIIVLLALVAIIIILSIIGRGFFFTLANWQPKKEVIVLENLTYSEIDPILQLRSMQVNPSCKIDTIKEHFFSDDRIVCSYSGTINIGIDFADTLHNWATKKGDSVFIKLPNVKILNTDSWVITGRSIPIEKGKWTNEDMAEIENRANQKLCDIAKESYPEAEANARKYINEKLYAMGFKYIDITFGN